MPSNCLTLLWRRPLSYKNQSMDLLCKSMDWFLYDNGPRHERAKGMWHVFAHYVRRDMNYQVSLTLSWRRSVSYRNQSIDLRNQILRHERVKQLVSKSTYSWFNIHHFSYYAPLPLSAGGRGVELPTQFSKKVDLTGPQFLERVAEKERVTFFRGVGGRCNFYIKNKLRSEIFNDKKV